MENIETLLAAAAVAQTREFGDDGPVVSTAPERGLEENPDSSPAVDAPPPAVDAPPPAPKAEVAPERVIGAGEKRKRGRPPKGQVSVKQPPPKRIKPEEEEEDVCFICFDGGSLVLCDRKGCPKAYHPACIKRSEEFFKSKAKWNCGWHICGVCQKSSHYMCYTCTYSLCKGCTKDADYLCVRGNKGFCPTCMKTIMLIENKDQANEVHVDFDDQTSWEYLFKVYWVILKENLSLTLDEIIQAKNHWKGVTTVGYKPLSSNVIPTAVSVEVRTENLEVKHVEANLPLLSNSKANHVEMIKNENGGDGPAKLITDAVTTQEMTVVRVTDKPGIEIHEDHPRSISGTDNKRCICKHMKEKETEKMGVSHSTEWATKALLEFVAHMKEGDTSAMSQFDVQTLLLDYVNRNNLWVAHRKNQIKCDPRLKNLFGKPRVSHVQMFKHLKSHFLVKENSQKYSFIPAGFVSSVKSDMEVDESDINGSDGKKDEYGKPSESGFPLNGSKPISGKFKEPLELHCSGKEERSVHMQNGIKEEKTDGGVLNNSDTQTDQVNIANLACDGRNDPKDMQMSGRETLTATASVGKSPSSNIMEIEKLWHYRDSDGKIRGPFSMMQLREWSTTGLYQPDMRIWTNHEQYDSLPLTEAMHGKFHGASDFSNSGSREDGATSVGDSKQIETPNNDLPSSGSQEEGGATSGGDSKIETPDHDLPSSGSQEEAGEATGATWVLSEGTNASGGDSKQIEVPNDVPILSGNNTVVARADDSGSWPQCWDFLKDDNYNNLSANDVRARDLLPSSNPERRNEAPPDCDRGSDVFHHHGENNSVGLGGCEVQNKSHNEDKAGPSSDENPRSLDIDLMCSNYMGLSNNYMENISISDFPIPTRPNTVPSDAPAQNSGILELLSPAPRSNNENEAKNPGLINLSESNSGHAWPGGVQIPELGEDWCKFSPTPANHALASAFSLRPPEITCEDILAASQPTSNVPGLLANINEPIEFDALGEESVSDLLAEVDAMESQGPLHSPTSAIKFARELLEDCKDDCFSSIEEFGSARKSDALSSTSCKPNGTNALSSASSEGETNHAEPVVGPDAVDPGWGTVQGNINLVTVQGNVNLVIGGPGGGMGGLGWGTSPGTGWTSPNLNRGPMNSGGSLPWDAQQRKYSGERFASPREWGPGYQQGVRAPWGRQAPYGGGGGGYSRPVPKGQRVCKFYGSGHCKKGAFCDYLHPHP